MGGPHFRPLPLLVVAYVAISGDWTSFLVQVSASLLVGLISEQSALHTSIDIRVEGLETASCERISGVTNRVARDHNGGVDGVSSTAAASSAGK